MPTDPPQPPPLDYSPTTTTKPTSPVIRFLIIIPLTILGFILFFAALVVSILPDLPLIARIGAAAILGTGVAYFIYWLIRSYRKKYAHTRPLTAKEKLLYVLIILLVIGLRILIEYLPKLLGS